MKFEPPIVKIEQFPLRDIISASNDDSPEDLPAEPAFDPDPDPMDNA